MVLTGFDITYRDGHHGATHVTKSVPGSASKHGSVPPSSSGMSGKLVPPHREHKHPPPMGPGSGRVTQARDAIRREQSYAREAVKRENNNQRGGEHMFTPPVRPHEPKEPLSQVQVEHVLSQHHGLPLDSALPVVNHLGSGMNSGINCNISSRKDNQGLEWTSEKVSDMDSRHGLEKSNTPGSMKSAENRHLVPLHIDSSSKRSQQQGFESSSRHGHRGSATNINDTRTVKEDVPSKMPSDSSDSQRHVYNHSRHSTGSDRLDHGRHRKSGVNEQLTSRPPQPSAEAIVERKPNISEMVERKPNVVDVVDRKPNIADIVDRKAIISDMVDRKSNASDQSDRKQNTTELQSSFGENRHESSNRKPGVPDVKHQPVQPYLSTKRESKPDINTVKKEDCMDLGSRVGGQSVRPPAPPPPSLPLNPPQQQQQPTAPASTQPPALPNAAPLPSHHHSQERHKSRPKSPSQVHEKPPSLHQQHPRSAVPARAKSPISAAIPTPSSVGKRSESPHARTKPATVALPNMSTPRNGTAVAEVKPLLEAKSRRPEVHVAKPAVTVDQTSVTVKLETDVLPHTSLKVSSGSQKGGNIASVPITPDKAGTTVLRESPHPRSSKSRQRTPPSSGSKKTPVPLSDIPSTPLSPFGSPPPPTPATPGSASKLQGSLKATSRHRTSSSSSEPELVPVVKKLDEIAGYENIIRDSKMGIKLPNRVPDIIPPIRDRSKKDEVNVGASAIGSSHNSNSMMSSVAKELKTPDLIRPFAAQMSEALSQTAKSVGFPDDLGAVAFPDSDSTNDSFVQNKIPASLIASEEALSSANIQTVGIIDISTMEEQIQPLENVSSASGSLSISEHHHKSEKKKRKREHKEHKHKDKDKNREEKKHKHKHRDKDKDRHKGDKAEGSAPIKITIPKDKINLSSTLEPMAGTGLKLKIQKDRLKGTDSTDSSPQSAPSRGLKIKISKEVIGNFSNSNAGPPALNVEVPSSSRKRDRSSPRSSELVSPPGPPTKLVRLNISSGEQRRSGNSCSNYGKQNGVEHHRRGSHYSTLGGKVRGGRGGPRGNCYMMPTLPMQQPQPYQPYPPFYQAYPPPPPGIVPQPYMYGYYPPATYMYQPPLPTRPAPDVTHPQVPPPLPEGPPPDDNPPPPPPPE